MISEDLDTVADISGGSDDEAPDKRKHAQLIDSIISLDGKKSHQFSQRTVPTNQVSEFGFTGGANKKAKVRLYELVGSLKKSPSHGELKKHLRTVDKQSKVVSVPLPKHERGKIERSVAYDKTSEELQKWDPVVKQNRQAEQIVYPLNQISLKLHTASKFSGIKPRTPLEMEVAALLHGSENIPSQKKALTRAEEKALQAMSVQEAKQRRAELQKHRALLSYKESKARWQKKIKSKKYHKVLRKEKMKHEKKALDEMEKTDPEGYQGKIDNLNKQRIQERMNLKHRGGSKYAKKQMIYAKFDDKARQSVQDMLQKSRELTTKVITEAPDDDSDEGVAMDSEDEAAMMDSALGAEGKATKNPWMSVRVEAKQNTGFEAQTEVISVDFQQDVIKLSESTTEPEPQEEKEGANCNEIDSIFSKPVDSKTRPKTARQSRKQKAAKKAKKVTQQLKAVKKVKQKVKGKTRKKRKLPVNESKDDDNVEDEGDELISEKPTRMQPLDDIENDMLEESEDPENEERKRKTVKSEAQSTPKVADTVNVQVDPKMVLTLETKLSRTETPAMVTGDDDDDDDDLDADEQQRMTIAQAFENDDVVDEFSREKREIVARNKPKDIDLTLPGWGEWGGTGIQVSKHKKKRFTIKAVPAKPRKDRSLRNVIISELKDEAIRKHQVSELPFPYVTVEQFQRSVRAPVGNNWNPETTFKQLIKPKVVTKVGSIIEPIDKSVVFKDKKAKNIKRNADMAFDDADNTNNNVSIKKGKKNTMKPKKTEKKHITKQNFHKNNNNRGKKQNLSKKKTKNH